MSKITRKITRLVMCVDFENTQSSTLARDQYVVTTCGQRDVLEYLLRILHYNYVAYIMREVLKSHIQL